MSNDALTSVRTYNTRTPQNERARADQVKNNAGGFVFEVTPETRLRRFLVLGTTGGTYYQGESDLTKENGDVVIDFATNRTKELVDILLEISEAGRAPKQNPTIFALAAAAGLGDDEGRKYALDALPRIARTGTHLFLFAKYVGQFRGWGAGLRKAVGNWYELKDADKLGYQMVKYRQREGWTHADLLRKTHPEGATEAHKALYGWVTPKSEDSDALPKVVRDFTVVQGMTDVDEIVALVSDSSLSWEMLPDAARTKPEVWAALVEKGMPLGALIRQLPTLTRLGVLKGSLLTKVVSQLKDKDALRKARIHPVNVLIAQRTYASGQGRSATWTPITKIVDALDAAFYASFGNVEPANKRTLNALDVSGSMGMRPYAYGYGNTSNNTGLTARDISAAMSLVTLATEDDVETVGFTGGGWGSRAGSEALTKLNISARQRLDDVINTISGLPFGTTDCALPMLYAREKSLEIDTFIIWTDSETWAGNVQPFQALRDYRKASGIDAKLIVCATEATGFSIADPRDAGMLDVVGFDSAVPNLIADFSAGRV